ncbi:hypothetical protein J2Y69_003390 [Microbacterium resistens]|uniref:Uncharacterized protein n=1 Tax=Microbacterium resistens TaxID=156977 RepID=A0ABU1SGN1_9MICO|nr:hypothetical protein [Microbacterium resistens]MDR6868766.1 hypothetical protein [Microbacterium resistens]
MSEPKSTFADRLAERNAASAAKAADKEAARKAAERERFARGYPEMAAAAAAREAELGRELTAAEMTEVGASIRTGVPLPPVDQVAATPRDLPMHEHAAQEALAADLRADRLAREGDAALNAEVAKYARQGYTVTDRAPGQVILQRKKPIGLFYILVMILLAVTIIGLILLFPILRMVNRKMETIVLTLDTTGRVKTRKS